MWPDACVSSAIPSGTVEVFSAAMKECTRLRRARRQGGPVGKGMERTLSWLSRSVSLCACVWWWWWWWWWWWRCGVL
jgi:hypothetical protein